MHLIFVSLSAYAEPPRLRLATTTSTENSGLLNWLHPLFELGSGAVIDVIAVGTGKALKLGANGDVDVVLVHAEGAEKEFVENGYGVARFPVMHNDFVIIGPESDPANIYNSRNVYQALKKIAAKGHAFISRGDDSGTHKKEQQLWKSTPKGDWYISAGQGMGAVLVMANEKLAYTLVDRGTFLAFKDKIDLKILFEGDPPLHNPYHVIAVNPKKHSHIQYKLAQQYIHFLTSQKGQQRIAEFTIKNQSLFYPDVLAEQVTQSVGTP